MVLYGITLKDADNYMTTGKAQRMLVGLKARGKRYCKAFFTQAFIIVM